MSTSTSAMLSSYYSRKALPYNRKALHLWMLTSWSQMIPAHNAHARNHESLLDVKKNKKNKNKPTLLCSDESSFKFYYLADCANIAMFSKCNSFMFWGMGFLWVTWVNTYSPCSGVRHMQNQAWQFEWSCIETPHSERAILIRVKDPSSLLSRCRLKPNPPNTG